MLLKLQKFVFSATLTYSSTSKKKKKDNFGKVECVFPPSHTCHLSSIGVCGFLETKRNSETTYALVTSGIGCREDK